jgi:hypothetical protein
MNSSLINNKEINSNTKLDARSSRTNSSTGGEEQLPQQVNSLNISNEFNGYEHPFAIYSIKMCGDGKYLIAAARGGHVTLFKFAGSELEKADEGLGDVSCLEIPILHRNLSGDHDETNTSGNSSTANDLQSVRQSTDKKVMKFIFIRERKNEESNLFRTLKVYFEPKWAIVEWLVISQNLFVYYHGYLLIRYLY